MNENTIRSLVKIIWLAYGFLIIGIILLYFNIDSYLMIRSSLVVMIFLIVWILLSLLFNFKKMEVGNES